ncbi:hypothetical protein [Clostridium sp. D33t1_170424_F3]|uniref:hypothetical protein n=1 Tax=Clostridium sp. D33t1_170424_F3 TaxID=2787099 RepID=UPI0018ABD6E5|nr:hypothetical protein [Clostridium sp. D33t1_170424_F3]
MSSFHHTVLKNAVKSRIPTVAGIFFSAAMLAAFVHFLLIAYDNPPAFFSGGSAVWNTEVRP